MKNGNLRKSARFYHRSPAQERRVFRAQPVHAQRHALPVWLRPSNAAGGRTLLQAVCCLRCQPGIRGSRSCLVQAGGHRNAGPRSPARSARNRASVKKKNGLYSYPWEQAYLHSRSVGITGHRAYVFRLDAKLSYQFKLYFAFLSFCTSASPNAFQPSCPNLLMVSIFFSNICSASGNAATALSILSSRNMCKVGYGERLV